MRWFQDAKRKLRLMLSEADLSPLTTSVAHSTGARPKSKKKQGAAAAEANSSGAVNGVSGVDRENEVAAFLRVQVRFEEKQIFYILLTLHLKVA